MTLKPLAHAILGVKHSEKLPAVPNTGKWRNQRRNACIKPKRQAAQKCFSISIFLYSAEYFKLLQRTSWWQCTFQFQQCYHKLIDMNEHFALCGGSTAGKETLSVKGLISFTKQDSSVITRLQ